MKRTLRASNVCDDGNFSFPKLRQASEWKFTYIYNERSIVSIISKEYLQAVRRARREEFKAFMEYYISIISNSRYLHFKRELQKFTKTADTKNSRHEKQTSHAKRGSLYKKVLLHR